MKNLKIKPDVWIYTILIAISLIFENKKIGNWSLAYFISLPIMLIIIIISIKKNPIIKKDELKNGFVFLAFSVFFSAVTVFLYFLHPIYTGSFTRGISNNLFMLLSAIMAILFFHSDKENTIKVFFNACCIAYGYEILIYIYTNGIENVIRNYFTSNELEIHKYGYIFGLFILYYFALKTNKESSDKWRKILAIMFCLLVGKRIVEVAVIFLIILSRILKRLSVKKVRFLSVLLIIGIYFFINSIHSGSLQELATKYDIDFSGRFIYYDLVDNYYDVSIGYIGYGIGFVDKIMNNALKSNSISFSAGLHNDLLRYYIDLGFIFFGLWCIFYMIYLPTFYAREYDKKMYNIVFIIILYNFINYMVSNLTTSYHYNMIYIVVILNIANYMKKYNNKGEKVNG